MELFCGPVIHSNNKRELIVLNYAEILVVDGKVKKDENNKNFVYFHEKSKIFSILDPEFVNNKIYSN